jgi:integrase
MFEAWVKTLKTQTGTKYLYCLTRLLGIAKVTPQELVKMAERDPSATWKALKEAGKHLSKDSVRVGALYAARRFLDDHGVENLPKAKVRLPDLVKEPTYLDWDQANAICAASGRPYNCAFKIMLLSGWGMGEFLRFNKAETWEKIKAHFAAKPDAEYFKYGFRGRKKNKQPFYSLVPKGILQDTIALGIPLPLSARGATGNVGIPLDDEHFNTARQYMESAFRTALKKAPIVVTQGKPTVHELRDTFLTRAVQTGCSEAAANFVMGHIIDPHGYNKCDRDDQWVWGQLKKIHTTVAITEEALAVRDKEIEDLRARLHRLEAISVERLVLAARPRRRAGARRERSSRR